MSLPTVVTSQHDHGSLSNTKVLTLSTGGSLVIKEVKCSHGSPAPERLFEIFISEDINSLYIRDCFTSSIAFYLNHLASPEERRTAIDTTEWVRRAQDLRGHVMMGVLFLQDPAERERLKIRYTLSPRRDPYLVKPLYLPRLSCLGFVTSIK